MADGEEDLELEVSDEQVPGGEPVEQDAPEAANEDDAETIIAFADEVEDGGEDDADATPLVKKLRDQLREAHGQIAKYRRPAPANEGDPEPVIPERPKLEDFDYDQDKFDAAVDERETAVVAHAEWKARLSEREAERARAAERQAKQLEQQRSALGVSDYEERAALVKELLTDAQIAILTNGAQNPARLIYALGRSPSKLDQLAGEDNLARFAVMIGGMEKDIKVTKRSAPSPDTLPRGATASPALNDRAAKELARLEREAARTGDRTALIQFRKKMNAAKAA
jgi:hypothetical protein